MSKDNGQSKVIGLAVDRVDGRLKVSGMAKYAAEYQLENLAYAVLVQSEISKGKIKNIDSSKAEKLEGVLLVLTYKNAPKIPTKASSDFDDSLHLLQNNLIHHDRQNIGVVVAETLEQAKYAASLLEIEYEKAPVDVDMDNSLGKARTPRSEEDELQNLKEDSAYKRGDFSKAFESAELKLTQTYITPAEIHSMLEPHATTAQWQDNKLTVWESTQAIFNTRNKLAKAFGLPPEQVRVITKFLGGGFGSKLSTWSGTVLCAIAAKTCKRPVQLALSRQNTYSNTGARPRTVQALKLGAAKSGRLTALEHVSISENCRFADFVEDGSEISTHFYSCPNLKASSKTVELDIGKPTWMRAPGDCPGSFALESAIDELAYLASIDPLQIRLLNYAEKNEKDNLPWSSNYLKLCYQKGSEQFGWHKRSLAPGSMKAGDKLLGWGVASACHPAHRMKASAKIELKADGTAVISCGTQDIGTGTYTICSQIAAETLALPLSRIVFNLGDTTMPEAPLSGGSMTAATAGSTVLELCKQAVEKLARIASEDKDSPLYKEQTEDIQAVSEGLYSRKNPEQGESFVSLLTRNGGAALKLETSLAPDKNKLDKYSNYSFGAHFAEVQIDPELGKISVTRFVSAIAAGRIINPKTAANQVRGGVIYGIGMALTEEILRDSKTGRVLNADLAEYHLPVHADIPKIEVLFCGEADPVVNELGVKGIGEISNIGVAAAIANAVYHASGKRIRQLPITLDKLL